MYNRVRLPGSPAPDPLRSHLLLSDSRAHEAGEIAANVLEGRIDDFGIFWREIDVLHLHHARLFLHRADPAAMTRVSFEISRWQVS